MFKVLEYFVHEIAPQRLVKQVLVKCDDFVGEATINETINGDLKLLLEVEWLLRPRLLNQKRLLGSGQSVGAWVKLVQGAV